MKKDIIEPVYIISACAVRKIWMNSTPGKKDSQQKQSSKSEDQNKENVVDADFEEVKEDKNDKDKQKRA